MERAMEMAGAICANAQIAVREAKRCIRMGMQTDIHTGCAFEAEAFGGHLRHGRQGRGHERIFGKTYRKAFYQPLSCTAGRLYGVRTETLTSSAACRAGRTGEGPQGTFAEFGIN